MTKKVPIAPKIKSLEKYESAEFPVKQYTTIYSSIYRIQIMDDKKFTMKKNKHAHTVKVTRIG